MADFLVFNWRDPRSPLAGGAEIRFVELFSRFLKKGHSVTLFCASYPGSSAHDRWNGFDIYHAGNEYTFQWKARRFYLSRLKEKYFDCVIEMINKIPLYTPRFVRGPLWVMVDHLFGKIAFLELPWPFAGYAFFSESLIPGIYRKTPFLVYSEGTRDDLIRRGIAKDAIRLVYNGVDTGTYFPDASVQKSESPTVLYLGRLKRYKRVDALLVAFRRVLEQEGGARLVIAGDGNDLPRLKKLSRTLSLEGKVTFRGYVSEEEKRQLFRSSWVLAVPSSIEGWGMASLEAQACGIPAVVADSPGLRETVLDGESGLIAGGDFPGSLAEKILAVLGDRAFRERLGEGALRFSHRFSWDRATEEILACCTGFASQKEESIRNL